MKEDFQKFTAPSCLDLSAAFYPSRSPCSAYLIYTILHAALTGIYLLLAFALKSTLWLASGVAIAVGLFGPCILAFCIPRYEYGSDDKSLIMVTVATAYASATFSGLFSGWYLQEYWYYGSIPNYKNVDLMQLSEVGNEGHYWFTDTAQVVPTLGGYRRYTTGDKFPTEHFVCVAPVLPINSSVLLPPPPYPFDVRFWVLADNDCCSSSKTVPSCSAKMRWDQPLRYGMSTRNKNTYQGDAISDSCGHWPEGAGTRYLTSKTPVVIDWTTPDDFDAEQKRRLTTARIILPLHAVLWPLWCIPLGILLCLGALLSVFKRRR